MRVVIIFALLILCLGGASSQAAGRDRYELTFDDVMVNQPREPWRLSRAAWLARVAAARARYEAFAARAIARAFGVRTSRQKVEKCLLPAEILSDPTLRANDLYVEKDEVFIFRGVAARRHRPVEFERLPRARVEALGISLAGAR